MELYVDGQRSGAASGPEATVDGVLEAVRQDAAQAKRTILALACDGIDVVGEDLTRVLSQPVSQIGRIEIQTGDPGSMVAEALRDARGALDAVERLQMDVVSLLGEGKTGDAMRVLSECIVQWHQINEIISQSLALLSGSAQVFQGDTERLAELIEPVRAKLTEVKEAVTARDHVLLADILEYEFEEVASCWRRAIDDILGHIDGSGEAPLSC